MRTREGDTGRSWKSSWRPCRAANRLGDAGKPAHPVSDGRRPPEPGDPERWRPHPPMERGEPQVRRPWRPAASTQDHTVTAERAQTEPWRPGAGGVGWEVGSLLVRNGESDRRGVERIRGRGVIKAASCRLHLPAHASACSTREGLTVCVSSFLFSNPNPDRSFFIQKNLDRSFQPLTTHAPPAVENSTTTHVPIGRRRAVQAAAGAQLQRRRKGIDPTDKSVLRSLVQAQRKGSARRPGRDARARTQFLPEWQLFDPEPRLAVHEHEEARQQARQQESCRAKQLLHHTSIDQY